MTSPTRDAIRCQTGVHRSSASISTFVMNWCRWIRAVTILGSACRTYQIKVKEDEEKKFIAQNEFILIKPNEIKLSKINLSVMILIVQEGKCSSLTSNIFEKKTSMMRC